MKKSTKIIAGLIAVMLTMGVAGCTKPVDYPDFYNPEQVEETSEKYVVHVQSEGGMPLSGVKVTAYRDGSAVKTSISANGLIELAITLGEYTLEVDETSLPAGYYLPENYQAEKTNSEKREDVTIKIPSKLLDTVPSSYAAGQIMGDFTFIDCTGASHKLSNSLKEKKAVVLNFFYTGCQPCRSEFPAVQAAYSTFSDTVDIYAICSTHQGDSNSTVSEFKTSNGLSFPMGIDNVGLISAFGVTAFPTTVIIDRYGLIAYKTTGGEPSASFWKNIFNEFTSDNYSQKPASSGTGGGGSDSETALPNIDMPDSKLLEAAANGSGVTATYEADEDEYAWPWLAEGTDYIYSSNKGKHNTYSTVHCIIEMNVGDVLSFEYNVSSESYDKLYAFVDGRIINADGWSATNGWLSADVYVADRNVAVDLTFIYIKDPQDASEEESGEDVAKIRNIRLGTVKEPMDIMHPAVYGMRDDKSFESYIDVKFNENDGYYHKVNSDGSVGSILYMSLIQATAWTDAHVGSKTTATQEGSYTNSIYDMTYNLYRTNGDTDIKFVFGGDDSLTDAIIEANRIQIFMDEPYYLIPVNKDMHDWMKAFTAQYAKDNKKETYEKEWLEMCYYFDHYGGFNESFPTSKAYTDPTKGLRMDNCYIAYEASDPALAYSETKGVTPGSNKAIIDYPLQTYRGTYYKFTAPKKGIYKVRSYQGRSISSNEMDPAVFITNDKGVITDFVDSMFDHAYFTSYEYSYGDFNTYLALGDGETVYLKVCGDVGATGYYDFSVEYLGETTTQLLVCVTDEGVWESEGRVSAIEYVYVAADDCYYSLLDNNVDYDVNGRIYVDFINANYMRYGALANMPLKEYVKQGLFKKYDLPENSSFRNAQAAMEYYLEQAEANDGMLASNSELVYILQQLIDEVCGGGGEGNGWLMFACYYKTFTV